jgi:ceramide glucosyltransferase
VLFAALGIVALAFIALEAWRLWPAALEPRRLSPHRDRWPSLTILRPIRGPDPGCAENTRALLEQDYPGALEVLFLFDSVADPSLEVVSELLRTHPRGGIGTVRIVGPPPGGRTGKLNAMVFGLAHSHGELVAVSDSDTRPPPDLLRQLVAALFDRPRAAATFAPIATAAPPRSAGEAAYALLVNAWYGPAAAQAAAKTGTLPFIMGELMVWRREALTAIGGFEVAEGQLVDDMFLGARAVDAGFENVTVPWRLPVVTEPLSLAAFVQVFRRWVAFSASGLPPGFIIGNWLRGAAVMLAWAALIGALLAGQWLAALFPLAALVAWTAMQLGLYARYCGHPLPLRGVWLPAVLPLAGALVSLSLKFSPRVEWRGRVYELGRDATLARGEAQPPLVGSPRGPSVRPH